MSTFHSYADYEIPLLQVLSDLPGGQGASKDVRDRFGERFNDRIPDEHRVYLENVHEAKWRNIVAWVRNALIDRGLMDAPAYGIWRITNEGRAHLPQAGKPAEHAGPLLGASPTRVPDRTVAFPTEGGVINLSAGQVLEAARREIAQGLPPEALRFHVWVAEVDGHRVGVKWLFSLVTGLPHADFRFYQARRVFEQLHIATYRVDDVPREEGKSAATEIPQAGLTKAMFIERAGATLERRLAVLGQAFTLLVHRDRLVQVHLLSFSGCHYEFWVHANSIELGLHFESSQKLNYERLAVFLPHQDALNEALGEQVRIEKWGQGLAKVFFEFSRPLLTPTLADEHAARLHRFITVTLPILREAYTRKAKRPQVEAQIEPPTRVHAIIDTQIATMRDFLNGRASRPSDERLCDWVNFCYEFELYREGRELFALVDPSQVNPWYYERTRRLAKVCAMKMAGQA